MICTQLLFADAKEIEAALRKKKKKYDKHRKTQKQKNEEFLQMVQIFQRKFSAIRNRKRDRLDKKSMMYERITDEAFCQADDLDPIGVYV